MIKRLFPTLVLGLASAAHGAGVGDGQRSAMLMLDRLEVRDTSEGNLTAWKAQAWLGGTWRKLWLKSAGNYFEGKADEAELQLLYTEALSSLWNVQAGWRRDERPEPVRDWFTFGVKGFSPFLFDVDVALFVGEGGRSAARIDAGYDYRFAPHLLLAPELELNLYGMDDPQRRIGAGFSDATLGLRLRYELGKGLAPYIGTQWTGRYNDTADFVESAGGKARETVWLAGIKAWF